MLLTAETEILNRLYGDEGAVRAIAEAGFDAVDYSLYGITQNDDHPVWGQEYKTLAKTLSETAKAAGVRFAQAHAPFPSAITGDDCFNARILEKLKRSIEFAGLLGAEVICVHPITFENDVRRETEENIKLYRTLAPYARDAGVKIGVENMFWVDERSDYYRPGACGTAERMIDIYDRLDRDVFTCLLDIGHCGLGGEKPDEFIRKLGKDRLGALHVHDNDNKTDQHTIPFSRNIDWNAVTKALHDIGYAGNFTFEANTFLVNYPREFVPEALLFLQKTGRFLISMTEKA